MPSIFSALAFAAMAVTVTALAPPTEHLRRTDAAPDYDTFSFSSSSESSLVWYEVSGYIPSTGRPYVGHVAIFEPSAFSFRPPTVSGCNAYIKTSVSSDETWHCSYATNGGFFTVKNKLL